MRILLDQNAPKGLTGLLVGHEVARTFSPGWAELTNGDLLTAAETAGFEVMITADQNLRYQQNLATRRIALVVLPTNNWKVLRENAALISQAVETAGRGSYRELLVALLPGLAFFALGRPFSGAACLALQASLVGWIPAALWAASATREARARRERQRALAARLRPG